MKEILRPLKFIKVSFVIPYNELSQQRTASIIICMYKILVLFLLSPSARSKTPIITCVSYPHSKQTKTTTITNIITVDVVHRNRTNQYCSDDDQSPATSTSPSTVDTSRCKRKQEHISERMQTKIDRKRGNFQKNVV